MWDRWTLVFGALAVAFLIGWRHVWNRDLAARFGGRF
jgi:hypothetical protein